MSPHIEPVRDAARYLTRLGAACYGDSLNLLERLPDASVNLVVASPPYALARQKDYGPFEQHEYVDWLANYARLVRRKLCDDGSFVLDLAGVYQRGLPVRSLYQFRVLLRFCDELGFFLPQDFYWNDPWKRRGRTEWVNKRKIRANDSVSTVWWFSKTEWPKTYRSNVGVEHARRARKAIEGAGVDNVPQESSTGHDVAKDSRKHCSSAIPSNLLSIPNAEACDLYVRGCGQVGLEVPPTRFPAKLREFFINYLSDPEDLVVDIFGGSNVTGQVAEELGRRWLSFEPNPQHVAASVFRFMPERCSDDDLRRACAQVLSGDGLRVADFWMEQGLHSR